MTMTVKLPADMEQALRQHSAALGVSASEVLRQALRAHLEAAPAQRPSAYELGQGLFGRHAGPENLAQDRKNEWLGVLEDKQARRRRRPPGRVTP
ncbi:MAG: ribbon-helix-helix protein, CopG family [Rubrivivax sp.]